MVIRALVSEDGLEEHELGPLEPDKLQIKDGYLISIEAGSG